MVTIRAVEPSSPLFGHIRAGDRLISINGQGVVDNLDLRFKSADRRLKLEFTNRRDITQSLVLEDIGPEGLGLILEDDPVRRCRCNCLFCFVHQQPKGLRRTLYVKDEDFRLSFAHGNFITLSNTTDQELERIVTQRLTPLYVSVHTVDDNLRRRLLGNANLEPIVPRLRYLTERGITLHTQVVLCPEMNDGPVLEETVATLAGLHPGVASLAVVPVGLTRYRERLPKLRQHAPEEAARVVSYLGVRQRQLFRALGTRFVWPADEFYIRGGLGLPRMAAYESMPQFENGVGMARKFIYDFNRRRRFLKKLNKRKKAVLMTGESAADVLSRELVPYLRQELSLRVQVAEVPNDFWGHSVTVSGLLTGQDLLRMARRKARVGETVILPPNCLNHDGLFLDDMTVAEFADRLKRPVVVGSYDLAATIREVFS
jgi:putative radical SAM enzyme (TIGR03279 family)